MIGLTPRTQDSFFYFLDPWQLATSQNNGWMDIHVIFRIWTQGAIGYTVSRLSRLFHVLQTRHAGGSPSRSASSCIYFQQIIFCRLMYILLVKPNICRNHEWMRMELAHKPMYYTRLHAHNIIVIWLKHWHRNNMTTIFTNDILKCIFVNEKNWISIEISLKFSSRDPIDNTPGFVQIMAWRRTGDKPFSEPMTT